MQDDTISAIHDGQPGFEDFLEEEIALLSHHARQRGICLDCLTDRLIVEMVANLARAQVPATDILGMVVDGLVLAEPDEPEARGACTHRLH